MKEFITSYRSSTISNKNVEQSIASDRIQKISKNLIAAVLLVGCFFLASTNICLAQANAPATASISTVVAEPTVSQWKSTVEYSAVITSLKASTAKILTNPNTPPAEHTLYTGFDRMLSYIQTDLETQADITKLAEKNYSKVVLEAPSDPVLINMNMSEFAALYTSLVDKLQQ